MTKDEERAHHQAIEDKTCDYGLCYNRKESKNDRYCRECQDLLDEMEINHGT